MSRLNLDGSYFYLQLEDNYYRTGIIIGEVSEGKYLYRWYKKDEEIPMWNSIHEILDLESTKKSETFYIFKSKSEFDVWEEWLGTSLSKDKSD